MSRNLRLLSFVLSLLMITKSRAQSLIKPLPKSSLEKQLNTSPNDSSRVETLVNILRYYMDYTDEPHKMDSIIRFYELLQRYKNGHGLFIQDKVKIISRIVDYRKQPNSANRENMLLSIKECDRNNDKFNEAFAWSEYATTLEDIPENDSAIESCYRNAVQLCKVAGDIQSAMYTQTLLAKAHLRQHKYDLSEKELMAVINYPKANTEVMLTGLNGITSFYFNRGALEKALYYALKCEKLIEVSPRSLSAIDCYNQLALIYITLGQDEKGIYWTNRCLEYSLAILEYGLVYKIMYTNVACYLHLHRTADALNYIKQVTQKYEPANANDRRILSKALGNIYLEQKNYILAERHFLEMHRLSSLLKDLPLDERANNNLKMGELYLGMKKYKKAKEWIDKSEHDYKNLGRTDLLLKAHEISFKADSALGLYPAAIEHLQASQQLYKTVFDISRNKEIEKLQIAYQTEKKEKDIALLKAQQRQQRIKLLQSENMKKLVIIGSCLLAIIIVLLVVQSRNRKRNNRIITQKNGHLEQLIAEKDWLLKEVHHRVKNNLHTVICLLESQAHYLEDDALKAIETSQHRIYAMSLIHQKLYQSDDIKMIEMRDYIDELVGYLKESFGPLEDIEIVCSVADVKLGVTYTVPLGLIINEAVTNAIQHAFQKGRKGTISIELKSVEDELMLVVGDNGIGLDYAVYESDIQSLGIQLIKGLTKELKGNVIFQSKNGTEIIVSFAPGPFEKMIFQTRRETFE